MSNTKIFVGERIVITPAPLSRDWVAEFDGAPLEKISAILVAPDPRGEATQSIEFVQLPGQEIRADVMNEFRRCGWTVEVRDIGPQHAAGGGNGEKRLTYPPIR